VLLPAEGFNDRPPGDEPEPNMDLNGTLADDGAIEVLGARVHNLKNIDVRIPRDKLVVITGLSGSGKSSLAFDTIHAEGQRRYIETFNAYAASSSAASNAPTWT
jgi:excinuclease UvrABC ATPase subunit